MDLDKHVQEVRGQYLATLANWPTPGSGRVAGHRARRWPLADRTPDLVTAGAAWGAAPEMNPLETAMWRAE